MRSARETRGASWYGVPARPNPPAPWHTGMPLIAPPNRLARPRVIAKRPGRTCRAASPKYARAVFAVARHELANDNGNCGSTRRPPRAENAAR